MSLFIYLLEVTFSMAIFYAFYYFALRRETLFAINRVYLLMTLVISLALPLLSFNFPQEIMPSEVMPTVYLLDTGYASFSEQLSATALHTNWSAMFLMVYLLGVIVLSLRLFLAYRQLYRIKKNGETVIIEGNRCVLSDQVNSPFSFFNSIYLPKQYSYQEAELAEVIAHEKAHIQDRHSWDVLLMELATIVCWVNPFIYLYKKSLADVHEYIADKAVLTFSHWENYAQLLVQQQYKQVPNALAHQLIYSQLKNRLKMMTRQPSGKVARLKYLGIFPAILVSFMLFSFTHADNMLSQKSQSTVTMNPSQENDMPLFPGCEKVPSADQQMCTSTKLNEYIANNLVFPKSLKKDGVEGKVIARFVVDSDGQVGDVTIVRSLQADADLAVLNLIRGMNKKAGKWSPATKEGKAVNMEMMLPVMFKFDEE